LGDRHGSTVLPKDGFRPAPLRRTECAAHPRRNADRRKRTSVRKRRLLLMPRERRCNSGRKHSPSKTVKARLVKIDQILPSISIENTLYDVEDLSSVGSNHRPPNPSKRIVTMESRHGSLDVSKTVSVGKHTPIPSSKQPQAPDCPQSTMSATGIPRRRVFIDAVLYWWDTHARYVASDLERKTD
jgi:hypothetical protein